jgi:aminocarboxymuconate-semialdehyde decarboxylase
VADGAIGGPAVDAHAHLVPRELLDDLQHGRLRFPRIEVVAGEGGRALVFADGKPTRAVPAPLLDAERRRGWMEEQRIGVQVVAGWLDMFGYALDPAEGAEWARTLSAYVKAAAERDGALIALGTVALQDPAGAADALRELVDHGFPGVMIATQIGERELDDPAFAPFWEAADDLGAVVYLHPSFGSSPRHSVHGLVNGLARLEDTTVTLARLLYAGIPARHPDMNLVASHGGGTLPYVFGRIARNQAVVARDAADPRESLAHLYFDSVVFDPAALRLLLDLAAPGHVMLGSDYPFPIGDLAPRGVVERAALDEGTAAQILSATAREVFGIVVEAEAP